MVRRQIFKDLRELHLHQVSSETNTWLLTLPPIIVEVKNGSLQ